MLCKSRPVALMNLEGSEVGIGGVRSRARADQAARSLETATSPDPDRMSRG